MCLSRYIGIRPVFIDIFSWKCSVSEQVGIRPVFNNTFLGSAVSGSEQVGIRPELNDMS